jgi:hypothetical protein
MAAGPELRDGSRSPGERLFDFRRVRLATCASRAGAASAMVPEAQVWQNVLQGCTQRDSASLPQYANLGEGSEALSALS